MIKLSLNAFSNININQFISLIKDYKNIECSTALSLKYLNGKERFASINFINKFNKKLKENNIQTSIHIFHELANILGNNKVDLSIKKLIDWELLDRIQINRYSINMENTIENCFILNNNMKVILPTNKLNESILFFPLIDTVDWLYDFSYGQNKEIKYFPIDIISNRKGNISYAGGINSNNIEKIMSKINQLYTNDKIIYLDIESGIRDINKISFEKIKNLLKYIN